MNMFKVASAAVFGLAGAVSASATAYPITFTAGTYTPGPAPVIVAGPTIYSDTYVFTTTANVSTLSASLTTRQIFDPTGILVSDLDFLAIDLDGIAFTPSSGNSDVLENWALPSTFIGAATHTITVNYRVDTADAQNGASYGGVFNLAISDVPEPASWAMMVGGFGLIGSAMRRSRSTKVAFA